MHIAPVDLLIQRVIPPFYTVYNGFGPGLLEGPYRNGFFIELQREGLQVRREVPFTIEWRGIPVGHYRADLVVNDILVIECKVADKILSWHRAQLGNYLTIANLHAGLILNFGPKPEIRRVNR